FKNKGNSLLSVGDINQSIMLWAGAKRTVFDDYIKDFNATKKLLVKNFRASDEIQEVLRCFIHYVQNDTNFSPIAKDINNCTIHFYNDEISEAEDLSDIIKGLIGSGISENEICVLTKQQSEKYTEQLRHSLTKKNIRNLEMSELQDLLKEPLGELFSACFKLYTSRSLSGYTDLCQLYLGMYRISSGDAKEELLIKSLSNEIARHRAELGNQPNADSLLTCIKETVEFFCIDRIKGRWGQYKSAGYWVKVWNGLEQHLRYTISSTGSLNDAVQLFGADNSVQVMNIHKCKGLEYKVVILLGLEDQAFWTYHSQKFENDCALYVALSRAKEKVIISTANFRSHRINSRY
ncbi:TPA: ATP-dependent helicase, partial [Klebsiella pneumoniae]|nr:ATP-dependent helicase [Klebsiella pneumoniae]